MKVSSVVSLFLSIASITLASGPAFVAEVPLVNVGQLIKEVSPYIVTEVNGTVDISGSM